MRRSSSHPFASTNARSASASRRQRSLRSGIAPRSARRIARSSATQQSAFDSVKCVVGLRTSQIPESGRRHESQTWSAIAATSFAVILSSGSTPSTYIQMLSITDP